jgi:hypothetical protein
VADISVSGSDRVSGGDPSFHVEVRDGTSRTAHDVTVPTDLAARLGWEGGSEELVRASFEFLLEREPAGSILRRFSLDVIGDYFPEYLSVMRLRPHGPTG